jgi:hypothetical protein
MRKQAQQNRNALAVLLLLVFCFATPLRAQRSNFFKVDTTLNKMKVGLVAGSSAAIFTCAMVVLNEYWYKDYPRSKFHSFNDGREWQGVDKAGHVFNTYTMTRWSMGMYRWSGMKPNAAILSGAATGLVLQSSIEILDGFSAEWGFSWWDMGANVAGAAIAATQQKLWKEQRISIKVSAFPQDYPAELQARADQLYGNTGVELFLKDYNALTTWASVSVGSFIKRESKFPKWFSVAFGYGAQNMYGGFENKWCADGNYKYEDCPDAMKVDRSDIPRYKHYYLSLDVDWTKIKTKRKGWLVLFNMMNMIKIPFPAVEFNSQDKVRFVPLHF